MALAAAGEVTHRLSRSEVRFRYLSLAEAIAVLEHGRAAGQGGRLRGAGTWGGVRRASQRQLFGRHGAAAVRDGGAARGGGRPLLARRHCRRSPRVSIEILVNVAPRETRAAILESGVVAGAATSSAPSRRGLVSNLYKGRVSRVLPGMQAAFVDIGLERTAFLHAADIAQQRRRTDTSWAIPRRRACRRSRTFAGWSTTVTTSSCR